MKTTSAIPLRLGLAAAMLLAGCPARQTAPAAGRYYRVQLHLHGSLSEGDGTMRGHNFVARQLGTVDGLWWTDHDWRIAGHGMLTGFGFESREETYAVPFRDTPWSRERSGEARIAWRARASKGIADHWQRLSHDLVAEGRQSLEIGARSAAGVSDWQWAGIRLQATNLRFQAPLAADPELEVDVYPVTPYGENHRLVIRLGLSKQPQGPASLVYVLGAPGEPHSGGRTLGIVPVSAPVGQWSRLLLRPTRDATELGLGGSDNSLRTVQIGVQVRGGAEASFYVDHLRIRRRRSGAEVLARAEQIAADLAREFELFNHVGLEVSYGTHMNVYLPEVELPDFERYPHGMPPADVVAWAHERGGVVSYNHVFGTGKRRKGARREYEERARYVIENRAFGADLLEVGYPHRVLPLRRHLQVWDELSRERVFLTGVGTSDSHGQSDGWRNGNNFVSWVWAAGPERRQLIAGLGTGRVFFANPVRFRGEIHLETADGVAMGQVVETSQPYHDVEARIAGLPEGCSVRWIDNGKLAERLDPPVGDFAGTYRADTRSYRFVRLEVFQGDDGLAFSNVLYFVPEAR